MKKAIGLFLIISLFLFSMSSGLVLSSDYTIDPVQTLLVEVLSWDNTTSTSVGTTFNENVLKPLVNTAVPTDVLAAAKSSWTANAQTSVKGNITWDTNATDGIDQPDLMLAALTSFKNADAGAKKIYTTAEMVNGYPDISSPGLEATGFNTFKATINTAMTGDSANDNGIKFVTLFLRELVRTDFLITNSVSDSVVSTYDGNDIDFYLKTTIDSANRKLIVTRVNGLLEMIPSFCSNISGYSVDNTVKVDLNGDGDISNDDNINYLGKFITYTETEIKKNSSSEIENFYDFLVAQGPKSGSTTLTIINKKTSSGGGSGGGSYLHTPTPTTPATTPPIETTPPVETTPPSESPTPTPEAGPTAPPEFEKFIDIEDYDWAETAINYLAYKGIIEGVTNDTYAPGDGIKRGDLAILMVRIFNLSSDSADTFKDVPTDSYYYKECRIGKNTGILLGVDEENEYYEPERIITREEMMALIVRSLVNRGYIEEPEETDLSKYKDQDQIEAYARPYISFLSDNGIIVGDLNGYVRPKNDINRAEAATMIYRLYKLNLEGLLK